MGGLAVMTAAGFLMRREVLNDTVDGLSVVSTGHSPPLTSLHSVEHARWLGMPLPSRGPTPSLSAADAAGDYVPPLGWWLKMCSIELNELSSVTTSPAR